MRESKPPPYPSLVHESAKWTGHLKATPTKHDKFSELLVFNFLCLPHDLQHPFVIQLKSDVQKSKSWKHVI